jgi:hypothetical protein
MRTSPKVKTTKVITGAMTVRGKPVSEAQRKAIWAKYGKHIWEMEDKTINDEVNKSKQEFPNDRFLRQTKNPVVRRPGATMYEAYKEMLKDDYKRLGQPLPPEGSNEFNRLILAERNEYREREWYFTKADKIMQDIPGERDIQTLRLESLNQAMIKWQAKRYNLSLAKIIHLSIHDPKKLTQMTLNHHLHKIEPKIDHKLQKTIELEEKKINREHKREQRLAEIQQRQEELLRRQQERAQKPKELGTPIIYTPVIPSGPKLSAETREQIRLDKEAKKKKTKWHDTRKSHYHTRSPVRKKKSSSEYSGWGDLIESEHKKTAKTYKKAKKKVKQVWDSPHATKPKKFLSKVGRDIGAGIGFGSKKSTSGKKKKGFFEYIAEEKEQADRYKREHRAEIAAKQAERKQAIEETKQELKVKSERVKADVTKVAKKFENPKVVGPGYDRWGYPIKKNEQKSNNDTSVKYYRTEVSNEDKRKALDDMSERHPEKAEMLQQIKKRYE